MKNNARLAQPPARKASGSPIQPAGLKGVNMKCFVYLLESLIDGRFYIGQTDNVEKRLKKHNDGKVFSTVRRRPLKMLGFVEVESRKEALQIEKSLKQHSDKKLKFIKKFRPDFEWKK